MLHRALMREQGNLPTEDHLKNIILSSESEMFETITSNNYSNRYHLSEKYGTGYYKSLGIEAYFIYQELFAEGVKIDMKLIGDPQADVIEISDRIAKVQLTGAIYEVTVHDPESSYKIQEDSSGIYHLMKTPGGLWKIYSFSLPVTVSNTM